MRTYKQPFYFTLISQEDFFLMYDGQKPSEIYAYRVIFPTNGRLFEHEFSCLNSHFFQHQVISSKKYWLVLLYFCCTFEIALSSAYITQKISIHTIIVIYVSDQHFICSVIRVNNCPRISDLFSRIILI